MKVSSFCSRKHSFCSGKKLPFRFISNGNKLLIMREKVVLYVVFSLLLAALGVQFLTPVRATTWTVDDDGPADFSTIQEAVDAPIVH